MQSALMHRLSLNLLLSAISVESQNKMQINVTYSSIIVCLLKMFKLKIIYKLFQLFISYYRV